jgi:NADPH:quinone reductase-like Zn-dependent oxidoreductase
MQKPVAADDEVLIRVHTAAVTRTDAGFRSAEYIISRFWSGLLRPKQPILGCAFADVAESVGSRVSGFKPGDRVFVYDDEQFGGHAEYVAVKESKAIIHIPDRISFEMAAAIPEGAHYALGNIRASGIKAGQHAMVYGASGAIGSAAVPLLKVAGVHVTAVCNTKNVDLVRSLGADEVIDYQTRDFTSTGQKYRLIFDAVGKSSFGACKNMLTEDGVYISTELGKNGENVWRAILGKITGGKRILFPIPITEKSDMEYLRDLVLDGRFTPLIDRTYPLDEIREAYRYVETGQKTGNVLIRLRD